MSLIPGSIPVTGFIAPTDTTDTYPVTDAIYGIDGMRNVADYTERDNISLERRRAGMVVGTINDGKYWRLKNQAWTLGSPSDWELFLQVGPSGSVISTGLKYYIEASDDISVPSNTQYWIYGDLTVAGQLTNNGQVVIANGTMSIVGGTFSNFGSLIYVSLTSSSIPSSSNIFTNTTTIGFTYSGSTVSANVLPGSLTASLLNTAGGYATAGYYLSVDVLGRFKWVGPTSIAVSGGTQGLSSVLTESNVTGPFDIIISETQSIKSATGGGQINFDWNSNPSYVAISSDSGNGLEGLLEVSAGYSALTTLEYFMGVELFQDIGVGENITNLWSTGTNSVINIGVSRTYSPFYDEYQDITIRESSATASVTNNNRNSIFIGTRNSTINAGLTNSVIISGSDILATQSNTLYTANFKLYGSVLGKYTIQPNLTVGFDDLTLVTKGWVDGRISSSASISGVSGVTAGDGLSGGGTGYITLNVNTGNGLSILSDSVVLGGTLSQQTTIHGNNNGLLIDNLSTSGGAVISLTGGNTFLNLQKGWASLSDLTFGGAAELVAGVGQAVGSFASDLNGHVDMSVGLGINRARIQMWTASGVHGAGDGSVNNNMVVSDGIGSKGLVYGGSYSANFTTYSLVTKEYVDLGISSGSNVVYSGSGLTSSGTTASRTIHLGGVLTQNAIFDGYYDVTFGNIVPLSWFFTKVGVGVTASQIEIIQSEIDIVTFTGSSASRIHFYSSGSSISDSSVNNSMVVTDDIYNKGLVYNNDYSGSFTNNSLVTKLWVDNRVTASFSSNKMSVNDKFLLAVDAVGDGQFSGGVITSTPVDGCYVAVYINGQEFEVGNGVTNSVSSYFSGNGGASARGFYSSHPNGRVQAGDSLYWNENFAGTDLKSGWRISLHYLI